MNDGAPKIKRKLLQQPQDVVNRWMRLRMQKGGRNLVRALVRWRLYFAEKERQKALEAAFNEIKKQAIKFEHGPYEASTTLFNIALFFLLAERDIQTLKIDALTHRDEWKRKLLARVILLTIHELDLKKVTGQSLYNAMNLIGVSDDLRGETIRALRQVRKVQERAQKEFVVTRNAAIAHRDSDALLQYRAIRNLNVEAVFSIAGEFYEATRQFIGIVPRLMLEANSLPVLLRQYSQAEENRSK